MPPKAVTSQHKGRVKGISKSHNNKNEKEKNNGKRKNGNKNNRIF